MEKFLDAKYNEVLDSAWLRLSLLAVGFSVWVIAAVGCLKYMA
jgi:hypothetical protein